MNDPWTWTKVVWGWTMGAMGGLAGGGQRGKIGATIIEKELKFFKKSMNRKKS